MNGLDNIDDKIPSIDINIESREVKTGMVYLPYIIYTSPYMIYSDKNGTRKVWTKNKKKIILYYLFKITRIEWFINKYNEQIG